MSKWENTKLSDISIKTDYGYTASASIDNVGPKFLRITDIVPYYVDYKTVPYCVISDKHFKQYKVEKGDLLVARTGATTGYNYVFNDDIDAVFASYLIRFRFDNLKALPLFMKYVMKSKAYKGFINNSIGGAAQPGINAKVLGRFNFNLPDLKTQQKIASILSAYDDLIEKNNRKIEILQDMAEELYKEWFVRFRFPGYKTAKFTDGIPDGWERKRITNYYDTCSGGTPSRSKESYYINGTYKWIKTGEIKDSIIIDTEEYITESALKSSSAKILPANSIVMAMYGVNIGMLGYIDGEMTCNQACCVLSDKRDFSTKHYLFYYLKSIREYLLLISFGAAQQNLSQELIKKVKILMPTDEVVIAFENKVEPIYQNIRNLLLQNTNLKQQRDLLLPRLMSGKLEVKVKQEV